MQRRTRATTLGALTTAVLTGLAVLPAFTAPALADSHGPDSTIFINEIHYDNDGTDAGEAIEVAGPAGTDLTGWSIVLYNGSNGSVYNTRELTSTLADQQDGYGTTVLNYPSNGIQNGPEDAIALVDAAGTVIQFLSYEGTLTAVGGPADGTTSTDIGVSQNGSDPVGVSLGLRGTGMESGDFEWAKMAASFDSLNRGQAIGDAASEPDPEPKPELCDIEEPTAIGAVQGSGGVTPMYNEEVTVEGVVVGDFQAANQLNGLFLQDTGDGDPGTSDGIFVYAPDAPDFESGDLVRVTGTATEFRSVTQIADVTAIGTCGGAAPTLAPTLLALPAGDAERERHEGMLVTFEQLTVTDTYELAQFGELLASVDGRLYIPTNDGTEDAAAEAELNQERTLLIDDASNMQYPDPTPFEGPEGRVVRLGTTLSDVVGVLSYGFGDYRLQPTEAPTVDASNPRPQSPDEVGGDIQVASFNVLNYFTTIDVPGAETDSGDDPRGADSALELERQRAKIVAAMLELDAEIVGLMEIENDADDEALHNLLSALNAEAGEVRYAAIQEPDTGDGGLFGPDAIKVAMIYQPDAVRPMQDSYTTVDDAFDNARHPLAQRFRPVEGGQPFTVVVNHFKSKGCSGATGLNRDQGDGQACYNADRVEQAQALLEMIEQLDGEDFLIIGDLNAYGEEDPVHVLEDAGYVDLVDTYLDEEDQYSYVYFGEAGYLDHALASPHLLRRVTGADIWHINADEPVFSDYNTDKDYPERFFHEDPYRSSDHDPVLVGLDARPSGPRR